MSNPWMCGASMGMVFCPAADSFAANSGAGFSLLFKSWVVHDGASYTSACLGVFALGALRQLLVGARGALAPALAPGVAGAAAGVLGAPAWLALAAVLAADAALFAATLLLAYLNMLVAMAYDFGLLGALVAGEATVHLLLALRAASAAPAAAAAGAAKPRAAPGGAEGAAPLLGDADCCGAS